jgi:osmoprotectant transport system permease protein
MLSEWRDPENWLELFGQLPSYLGGHLTLSLTALAVGLLVSVPLGVVVARRPRLSEMMLGVAGVIQTVPSLALLALMVPLLGGIIGYLPAFLALVLYSILPILANTVVGLRGVDPVMIEAARGLGMSDLQMLRRVQLPLAAPVIIGGIRTATVLVVGTATLATPVGETTLGSYIFEGLETRKHLATAFGCVFAALLAVVLDQLIRLLERAAAQRSRKFAYVAGAGLAAVIVGGLWQPVSRWLAPPKAPVVVIGSGSFTEQHVLSDLLRQHLQDRGFTPDQRKCMSEGIQFDSLRAGHIDCCVSYTGNIWVPIMKRTDVKGRRATFEAVRDYLWEEHRIVCLDSLGFENAYALAMRKEDAERYHIKTIADLAEHSPRLTVAGDLQIFGRMEWPNVCRAYGLEFKEQRPMDPTLMYTAVSKGTVDVICAYTSDYRVEAENLVILEDPKEAFPPYDAIVLVSEKAAARPGFVAALKELCGTIDVERMRRANKLVDVDNQRTRVAAASLRNLPSQ